MRHFYILIVFIIITATIFSACSSMNENHRNLQEFMADHQAWHQNRIENLKAKDGWLTLVGLFWLNEGENSIGSDSSNAILFPEEAPAHIGVFLLQNNQIQFTAGKGIIVLCNGNPVTSALINSDADGKPDILSLGRFTWNIIKRGERFGVRIKDSENPSLHHFKGIDMFQADPVWRVKARLESYDPPKKIRVPNVLGTVSEETCPGSLAFEINGLTYRLDPIAEEGSKKYFIIFADETNDEETYGAGRFLYADMVDEHGETIINFNRAYNPPCAFSEYATCPLPPIQNHLKIRVTAGEKKFGDH